MQIQNSLTEGSVRRQLIRFSFPFFLSSLIQNLYMTADMLIVQWVNGAAGSSAVGIGGELVSAFTFLIIGFASGGTVLISQYAGARRGEDVEQTIGTLFILFAVAAIFMTLIMYIAARPFLVLLKTPAESFDNACSYMRICMLGNFFVFEYNAISSILNGTGDSTRPLIFVLISGILNIILDLLFVAGFRMGPNGSAFATVISQAASFFISAAYLIQKGHIFRLTRKNFRLRRSKVLLIIKIGFPAAVQNSISSVSFLFLTSLINQYGYAASAAAQLAGKFNNMAMLPSSAMSAAMAVMSGQNIGAKKYERALSCLKEGIGLSLIIGIPLFLATVIFTPQFMSLLARGEPDVIRYGALYIRGFCADYLLTAFVFSANGFITGTGHTLITLSSNILQGIIIRIPVAWVLAVGLDMGILGIGIAVPAATLGGGILVFAYISSGKWRQCVT